jgi:hypothetical protein
MHVSIKMLSYGVTMFVFRKNCQFSKVGIQAMLGRKLQVLRIPEKI